MAWTSPRTWVTSEVVTAALLNTHVRDNLKAIGDAWTSYTVSTTNVTIGTGGTIVAYYMQAGKLVHYRGLLTLGTGGAFTGTARISLPATSARSTFGAPLNGIVTLVDTSASARRFWAPAHQSATEFYAGDSSDVRANATNPWTWANGDTFEWSLSYEAA